MRTDPQTDETVEPDVPPVLEFPRWLYPKDGRPPFVAQTPDDYHESEHSLTPVSVAQNVNVESAEAIAEAHTPPRELDKLIAPDITESGHSPAPAPAAAPHARPRGGPRSR